jgi:hypothetical protein
MTVIDGEGRYGGNRLTQVCLDKTAVKR